MRVILIFGLLLALATAPAAAEWSGKFGGGVRGGSSSLLLPGSDFIVFQNDKEPFMLSYSAGGELRYGLSRRFVLAVSYRFTETYDDSTETASQSFKVQNQDNASSRLRGYLFDLTASYYFRPDKSFQPYLLIGGGVDYWVLKVIDARAVSRLEPPIDSTKVTGPISKQIHEVTDLVAKVGGGLNQWIGERFTVDLRTTFTFGILEFESEIPTGFYGPGNWESWTDRPFRARWEASLGIGFYLGGGRDTDDDGVKDNKDDCPSTPLGARVDLRGCPIDSDGDGVYDGLDECPQTPSGARVDIRGCPLDGDKDGIFDGLDECPQTPSGVAVDGRGCPTDGDGDGVPDYQDKCPDTPTGVPVDKDGCPLDSDGDGVVDGADRCPGTPADVKVDSVGCPIAEKITTKITLSDEIKYELNSFEITDAAKAVLDRVAESMKAYPDTRIRVSGFCDASGPEEHNLRLSEKRAQAVYDYLVTKGVDPGRMMTMGFGENPQYFVADNDTREGRQKNRRVEIESMK